MDSPENELDKKLLALVWGENMSDTIFQRWSQGFEWSPDEKCALVQHAGGPCAVIAPMQGFLLKNILFKIDGNENLPSLTNQDAQRTDFFVDALCEVLTQFETERWVICKQSLHGKATKNQGDCLGLSPKQELLRNEESSSRTEILEDVENLSLCLFHRSIRLTHCTSKEMLKSNIKENISEFYSSFGVVKLLYSIILSKGINNVLNEMDNPEMSLVDPIHGHGSQNLINLMICGQAVSNVFDGDRDVAGLKLRGITNQVKIGFLTLLEQLRYLKVGNLLKRPVFPIWLVGSETHLSLVYSLDTTLVAEDTALQKAHKVFDKFDPEDNGFIPCDLLKDMMEELELVCDPEYVKIMIGNLDPEELGVVIRTKFFQEFYNNEVAVLQAKPLNFNLLHYNGLTQSSSDGKVRFRRGTARQIDWQEGCTKSHDSQIESCLHTRWPGLWISWDDGKAPSLN
uniref:Ubiquitin carboxyl-terminal hydrolase MINDY n=1 Tax=Ciona intestinalis TaxID=7719 RepID=F6S4C0_CIOIN